jgi:hypothetical protein
MRGPWCRLGSFNAYQSPRTGRFTDDISHPRAHWYAGGLYIKDTKTGALIQADKVYRVKQEDFVYNRLLLEGFVCHCNSGEPWLLRLKRVSVLHPQ